MGPGPQRLFVTGTDTEVGKTLVTAALATAWRAAGAAVIALKPLATGGPPPGEDALLLGRCADHPPRTFRTALPPAAPARAFLQAGEPPLDFPALIDWIRSAESPHAHLLVEGVGGWHVPLSAQHRVSDLAATLGYPVLLVADNRLGVLNHTLLTAEAVQHQGLPLAGVVLNERRPATTADEAALRAWNHEDLCAALAVPVLRLPPLTLPSDLSPAGEAVLQALRWPLSPSQVQAQAT